MRNRIAYRLIYSRSALIAFTAMAALTASIAIGGQNPQSAPQKPVEAWAVFDVASVRLNDPAVPGRPGMFMNFGGGCGIFGLQVDAKRIAVTAFPYALVSIANGKNCQSPENVTGGPEWIKTDRYDIEAAIPEGTPTYTPAQVANREAPKLQMMMEALLEDRFKLKVHREMKELPAFVLTAGKGTPKMTAAGEADQAVRRINLKMEDGKSYGELLLGKGSMADLANMVAGITKVQVQDKTGITGQFNLRVEYDNNGVVRPTIAAAIQEQIGLKLDNTKVATEVVVIDHIEKPSEN